jgi:hypothetical protein
MGLMVVTEFQVSLFGTSYEAMKLWNNPNWADHLPRVHLFLRISCRRTAFYGVVIYAQSLLRLVRGDDAFSVDSEEEDEADSDTDDGFIASRSSALPWWKSKITSSFSGGREDTWFLSRHCASRTQMYHNLLHYKFRLLLKVNLFVVPSICSRMLLIDYAIFRLSSKLRNMDQVS